MYCGSCGTQLPDGSAFCSNCGKAVSVHLTNNSAASVTSWEYKDINLEVSPKRLGWVRADMYPGPTARLYFWQAIQSEVMQGVQKLRDDGWEAVTEVGPSCVQLKHYKSLEGASFSQTMLLFVFTSGLYGLIYPFTGSWKFKMVGFQLQMRRPAEAVQEKESGSANSALSLSASNAQSLVQPIQVTKTHKIVRWALVFDNQVFELPKSVSPLRVGRNSDNELVLNDPSISGYHALVEIKGDALEVADLGSTNGTTVNGSRLNANQPRQVQSGDYLQFGLRVAQVRKS
jgi:FHA domain/zinc-ribbon domain